MLRYGKNEQSPKGDRRVIGHGQEGTIYQYESGPFKGLVGKVFKNRFSLRGGLYRFRCHQLAYMMFPKNNLEVVKLDTMDCEMFSRRVSRSTTNVLHATKCYAENRSETYKDGKIPPIADKIRDDMLSRGIELSYVIANISILDNNPVFFEVVLADSEKAIDYASQLPMDEGKGIISLARAKMLERSLDDVDLAQLIRNVEARQRILEREKSVSLVEFYDSEIGKTLLVNDSEKERNDNSNCI